MSYLGSDRDDESHRFLDPNVDGSTVVPPPAPLPAAPPVAYNKASPKKHKHSKGKTVDFQVEHSIYKKYKYYTKLNKISYGPGRKMYAWAAFFTAWSVIFFSGGIIIVCVQKFHRWPGYTDKMEFIGPCFFGLWMACIGLAIYFYNQAYKLSCAARRQLRLKGNYDGTGVYLVNPSADEQAAVIGGGVSGGNTGVELKTGQKTDRAVKPRSETDYAEFQRNRAIRASMLSSSTANTNTPWTRTTLPPAYQPQSTQNPLGPIPGQPVFVPTTEPEYAVPSPQPALYKTGSQGSISKLGSRMASVDSMAKPKPVAFEEIDRADKMSVASSAQTGQTGGAKKAPPTGAGSLGQAPGNRPKPKISGMSSLGGSSSASGRPSTTGQ